MVIPNLTKEFYQESEAQALQDIRYLQADMGMMASIREAHPDDWEIEELTRAIIFDEAQIINSMKGEAERARAAYEESQRV